MRMIHIPPNEKNPYFPLLRKYLIEAGVEVDQIDYLSVNKALHGNRYDLIHVHFIPHTFRAFLNFMLRILVYRSFGARIIKTCHNIRSHSEESSSQAFWYEKIVAYLADYMIFFTEEQRQEFYQYYRLTPRRNSIISHPYLGIFPSEMTRESARLSLGIHHEAFVYLIFGGVLKFKNYALAIEVFQQIRDPQDRLLVVIHPHSVNEIEQEAYTRCIQLLEKDPSNIITSLGFVENDLLQRYFNAADVILLPFEDNTSSTTFMLTLDFEKPFIVIRNSFNQYVLNENCGIYIQSIDELRDAMIRIKEYDLQTMKQNIAKRKPLFSWDNVIQKHIEAYQTCLSADK